MSFTLTTVHIHVCMLVYFLWTIWNATFDVWNRKGKVCAVTVARVVCEKWWANEASAIGSGIWKCAVFERHLRCVANYFSSSHIDITMDELCSMWQSRCFVYFAFIPLLFWCQNYECLRKHELEFIHSLAHWPTHTDPCKYRLTLHTPICLSHSADFLFACFDCD